MISTLRHGPVLLLAFASLSATSGVRPGEASLTEFLKYVYTPLDRETARLEGAKRFVETTRESIVFTNETEEIWKFGMVLDGHSSESKKQSGTLRIRQLKGEDASLETIATLVGDEQPVTINPRFNTIVVTPIQVRNEDQGKQDFFRICYLQDSAGKRVFFSLNKAATAGGKPRLGFEDQNKTLAQDALRLSPNGDNLFLIAKERLR